MVKMWLVGVIDPTRVWERRVTVNKASSWCCTWPISMDRMIHATRSFNVNLGGHSTARGAILGAVLGAAHGGTAGPASIPFYGDLAAYDTVVKEIDALAATF